MRNGYSTLRNGSRIIKLVSPRGGIPTHRLTAKVISKSGDDLVVRFDDQIKTTLIQDARRQYERGAIRKATRR